jgi:hypothetical protein
MYNENTAVDLGKVDGFFFLIILIKLSILEIEQILESKSLVCSLVEKKKNLQYLFLTLLLISNYIMKYHQNLFFSFGSIRLCTTLLGLISNRPPSVIPSSRPNLPMNIPPPPSFASLSSKSGKYQIISAEYYSEDAKPFLYKRLVKLDTSTERLGFYPLELDLKESKEDGYLWKQK